MTSDYTAATGRFLLDNCEVATTIMTILEKLGKAKGKIQNWNPA